MSWERDPLWAKARLFLERALAQPRDSEEFGLWCSLGLELLARAAVASISPTLLAEADQDHRFLLHALNRGSERTPRKSIGAAQVLSLCRTLFTEFTEDDQKTCQALINRRNEELHSGSAAFEEYPPRLWLAGFYHACQSLSTALSESLESLFGDDEAEVAKEMLVERRNDIMQRVQSSISAHRKVFHEKPESERQVAKQQAEELGVKLATQRHHRVTCPACDSIGTVQGKAFGPEHVTHEDGTIEARQAVSPTSFSCPACGLKFQTYGELDAAGLGGHYTRRTSYSPEEYYGLVAEHDLEAYFEQRLADLTDEYDNE